MNLLQQSGGRNKMTTPTNQDMERLLAQEPYLGAEHLQSQYEIVETYMAQESFRQSRKLLRKVKKGEIVHPNFVNCARTMISYAVNELEKLSQEEIAQTFSKNSSEEKNQKIRAWCEELSRTYLPLMILLDDTA
jgi:hypothetical protein